jgi:hypothetical protein
MKAFIKKYWLATILFCFIVSIFIFIITRKGDTPPTPTPTPIVFEVKNTYPNAGSHQIALDNLAIEFLFSKEVDLAKTAIKISPATDINISYGDTKKSVIVRPEEDWTKSREYKFTISAFSLEGESLEYNYNITFEPIGPSDFQENFSY